MAYSFLYCVTKIISLSVHIYFLLLRFLFHFSFIIIYQLYSGLNLMNKMLLHPKSRFLLLKIIMSANPVKGPVSLVNIIIQCSEGRFDLALDSSTSIRETKRAFKRSFSTLGDVNMNSFVISYNGKYYPEESATLKSLGIEGEKPAIFFFVKKRDIPSLNPVDAE